MAAVVAAGALVVGGWRWLEYRREATVIRWLRDHAIVHRTIDPAAELTDLQPVGNAIGEARIVGVGEATHGTREHSLYKHRLLRYLVTEKGFRALAFESPWPTGLDLNQYVLGGDGDPVRLLGRAVFGVWHTDEVLEMVRWMREYNATVARDQRVEFVGIDHQLTRESARAVADYLGRVDSQLRADHWATLALLQEKEIEGLYFEVVDNERRLRDAATTRPISAAVRTIRTRFDTERERYIVASSTDEFDLARQHATILVQQADVSAAPDPADRDRYMADNLDWYLARRPTAKIMIWAHNGHVDTRVERAALGRHLRNRHGQDYVSVGFVLGSGAYRALDARNAPRGSHRYSSATFAFGPPPAGTIDALLARTGYRVFAVDLRPARGAVREFLDRPIGIRKGAGIVGVDDDPLATVKRSLPSTHDLLIYIDPTTPARAIVRRSSANSRFQPTQPAAAFFRVRYHLACGLRS
ncbi:MAG TPA: erythromycin esterase family protein [Thermoanaerobaculia bacterium]|nr:erythromycin esterase family protein [Thermoanaerobaculia bacterium]